MACGHFGFEQELATGGGRPQLGDPLGRLNVEHSGVIERGDSQNVRVVLSLDVSYGE